MTTVRMCKLETRGGFSFPDVEDSGEAIHKQVGDFWSMFSLPPDLQVRRLVGICQDNGWANGEEENIYSMIIGQPVPGTILIAKVDPPDFVPLTDRDVHELDEYFGGLHFVILGPPPSVSLN